jgi:hypothetical protein
MPRFTVLLTRDLTESTCVTVQASNAEAAVSAAFAALSASSDANWNLDEGSWNLGAPYITALDPLDDRGCLD